MAQKLAAYDAQGNIIAFYDTLDSPAPDGVNVIEISDSQWQNCVIQQGQWHIVNGALALIPPPSAAQLLSSSQAARNAILNAACSAAIMSGFSSNALGPTYNYPSTLTDQTNQNTVAQCASGGLLWCEIAGSWSFKQHTQSQAQAVVASFSAWLNKCQQQLVDLMNQVNAATSVSAVESITWTNPS
ncbi:hypothetical protein QZN17_04920 [Burkholderia multivorans]|nr:hypothetical protein [Burkholderia multivorans]